MKTFYAYSIGFVLSVCLTLIAFVLDHAHEASGHVFPTHTTLLPVLIVLALTQLFVQLFFFLLIGQEQRPRWNLTVLALAALIVVILVGGTLWIMTNLAQGHIGHQVDVRAEENIFPTSQ
jgi:cytochrome o ubiquinol oxidase operon protein cyoD